MFKFKIEQPSHFSSIKVFTQGEMQRITYLCSSKCQLSNTYHVTKALYTLLSFDMIVSIKADSLCVCICILSMQIESTKWFFMID